MPQYPIPPWPEGTSPLTARRCRVRASGRHRFVPVVHGDADGVTVHLDSGEEAAIEQARLAFNAETLFFQDNVGKPHLVVANRMDVSPRYKRATLPVATLVKVSRRHVVGKPSEARRQRTRERLVNSFLHARQRLTNCPGNNVVWEPNWGASGTSCDERSRCRRRRV